MTVKRLEVSAEEEEMALRHVYIVLSLFVLSGFVSSQSIAADSCENPQLRKKLSALEDEWFKRPLDLDKLNTFTARLGELNNTYKEIADPSCRVADKPGQKPNLSSEFRRFHLKVMEVTVANSALESCARDKPILLSKVDKIIRNLAKIDDMGVCTAQRQQAVDELDLYSKMLNNQKTIYVSGAAGSVPIDVSNLSTNQVKKQLFETSVQRYQDNLSFSSVHAGNDKLIRENSNEVERQRAQDARDLKLATNQGAEAVEWEIRKKFGFDIYGDHFASDESHERRPEALARASKLHLSVMDGNRVNCLRNYLYFTNRFTFADADKKVSPGTAVKNLFGSDFGHEPGGMAGHQRDAKALTQVGNDTLKEFAKTYKDAPTLDEDTVLKMLEPTLDLMRDQASLDRTANDQLPMYYDGGQKAIQEFQQRKAWAKGMSAQKKMEVLAASAKSEVGFLYGTKAMKKLLYVDWKLTPEKQQEEKRRLIREALKERVGEAEKYADWIKEHQNPKGNDLGDFAKDGELLVYSAPNVIASTIHDDPSLLASMCDPLKKAASNLKGGKSAVAQAFEYGGAGMAIAGGPVGMVAGTAFGLVATGVQTFDNARRAAILERDAKYAGKGESVLDTDARMMAEGDKVVLNKAADEAWNQAWDELKGGLTNAAVGVVGGKVVQAFAKEVSIGMKAYREANALKKAAEVSAKELDEARNYFKFSEQAADLADGAKKTELLTKAKAWDDVVAQFESKLGRKLTPEELDEFMVYGYRGHVAGEGKTLKLADGTVDKEKAQGLQDLKNHVKDKLQTETGSTNKVAKKDAYNIVNTGAKKEAMVFGDADLTADNLTTFVARDAKALKAVQAQSKLSEDEFGKYLQKELDDFTTQAASMQKKLEGLPKAQRDLVQHQINSQLQTYSAMVSNRVKDGEKVVADILKEKGFVKGSSMKDGVQNYRYSAPPEPVVSAPTTSGPYTQSVDDALQTLKDYKVKYNGDVLATENKVLYHAPPSTAVKQQLIQRIEEQKKVLEEVKNIETTYKGKFNPSKSNIEKDPGIERYARYADGEVEGRAKALKNSIDDLNKMLGDVNSSIKRGADKIENLNSGDFRKYSIDRKMETFAETNKKDTYFIGKVQDEYRDFLRMRKNFTDADIPGLNGQPVTEHMQRLEKYLKDMGADVPALK